MNRPTITSTFMDIAKTLALRATCSRRQVGCVLVNKLDHIIATGYNGVPRGNVHCLDKPCPGSDLPSGEGHDMCEAIHAEQNALLQCGDVQQIYTCYTTTAPCVTCVKLLLNTSCTHIYFSEEYGVHPEAQAMWEAQGRVWRKL